MGIGRAIIGGVIGGALGGPAGAAVGAVVLGATGGGSKPKSRAAAPTYPRQYKRCITCEGQGRWYSARTGTLYSPCGDCGGRGSV